MLWLAMQQPTTLLTTPSIWVMKMPTASPPPILYTHHHTPSPPARIGDTFFLILIGQLCSLNGYKHIGDKADNLLHSFLGQSDKVGSLLHSFLGQSDKVGSLLHSLLGQGDKVGNLLHSFLGQGPL